MNRIINVNIYDSIEDENLFNTTDLKLFTYVSPDFKVYMNKNLGTLVEDSTEFGQNNICELNEIDHVNYYLSENGMEIFFSNGDCGFVEEKTGFIM